MLLILSEAPRGIMYPCTNHKIAIDVMSIITLQQSLMTKLAWHFQTVTNADGLQKGVVVESVRPSVRLSVSLSVSLHVCTFVILRGQSSHIKATVICRVYKL